MAWATTVAIPSRCQSSGRPAELVDQRPEVEGDVGDAATHDDLGALAQRLDDPLAAGVDGRVREPLAHLGQVLAGVEVREADSLGHQAVDVGLDVVAGDDGDPDPGETQLLGERRDRLGGGPGVGPAGVGDHADPLLDDGRERPTQEVEDVTGVAAVAVLGALLGQDRHGQLGQVVAAQVVDVTALDHLDRRLDPVPPERHAGAEPDRLRRAVAAHARPRIRARLPPRMPSSSSAVSPRLRIAAISAAGSAIGQSEP